MRNWVTSDSSGLGLQCSGASMPADRRLSTMSLTSSKVLLILSDEMFPSDLLTASSTIDYMWSELGASMSAFLRVMFTTVGAAGAP